MTEEQTQVGVPPLGRGRAKLSDATNFLNLEANGVAKMTPTPTTQGTKSETGGPQQQHGAFSIPALKRPLVEAATTAFDDVVLVADVTETVGTDGVTERKKSLVGIKSRVTSSNPGYVAHTENPLQNSDIDNESLMTKARRSTLGKEMQDIDALPLSGTQKKASLLRASIDGSDLNGTTRRGSLPTRAPTGGYFQGNRGVTGRSTMPPRGVVPGSHYQRRNVVNDVHSEIDKLVGGMQEEIGSWRDGFDLLRDMWVSRFLPQEEAEHQGDREENHIGNESLRGDGGAQWATKDYMLGALRPGYDGLYSFSSILEQYLDESDGARGVLEEELGKALGAIDEERYNLQASLENERQSKAENETLTQELHQALEKLGEEEAERNAVQDALRAAQSQANHLQHRVDAKETDASRLETSLEEVNRQLDVARDDARTATDSLAAMEVSLLQQKGAMEDLRSEHHRVTARLSASEEALRKVHEDCNNEKEKAKNIEAEHRKTRAELSQVNTEKSLLGDECKRLRCDLAESETGLRCALESKEGLAREMGDVRLSMATMKAELDSSRNNEGTTLLSLSELEHSHQTLQSKYEEVVKDQSLISEQHRREKQSLLYDAEKKMANVNAKVAEEKAAWKRCQEEMRAKYENLLNETNAAREQEAENLSRKYSESRESLINECRTRERELGAQLRNAREHNETLNGNLSRVNDALVDAQGALEDMQTRFVDSQIRSDSLHSELVALRSHSSRLEDHIRKQAQTHSKELDDLRQEHRSRFIYSLTKYKSTICGKLNEMIEGRFGEEEEEVKEEEEASSNEIIEGTTAAMIKSMEKTKGDGEAAALALHPAMTEYDTTTSMFGALATLPGSNDAVVVMNEEENTTSTDSGIAAKALAMTEGDCEIEGTNSLETLKITIDNSGYVSGSTGYASGEASNGILLHKDAEEDEEGQSLSEPSFTSAAHCVSAPFEGRASGGGGGGVDDEVASCSPRPRSMV